jgi:hypothetical protein
MNRTRQLWTEILAVCLGVVVVANFVPSGIWPFLGVLGALVVYGWVLPRHHHRNPPVPRNVRLIRPDGESIPLELVYIGRDSDGLHTWQATICHVLDGPGWHLCAEVIPRGTRIVVGVTRDD